MDTATLEAVRAVAARLPVVTAADVARRGLDGMDLRAACLAGELVRIRFGAYTSARTWASLDALEQYRLRVLAAGRAFKDPIFSHDSAAALWRLPRVGAWPAGIHVSVPEGRGARSVPPVRRHAVSVTPSTEQVEGLRTTTAARTVVDIGRSWTFSAALSAADHVLHTGLASAEELRGELQAIGTSPGSRRARRVVLSSDGRAESVGESLSRARMTELGLAAPVLQHDVVDGQGTIGRVDFWWPALGLVGEFDGRLKYRVHGIGDRLLVGERVWAEKVREDRLRRAGLRVVRWTWDTALDATALAARLAAAGLHPSDPHPSHARGARIGTSAEGGAGAPRA